MPLSPAPFALFAGDGDLDLIVGTHGHALGYEGPQWTPQETKDTVKRDYQAVPNEYWINDGLGGFTNYTNDFSTLPFAYETTMTSSLALGDVDNVCALTQQHARASGMGAQRPCASAGGARQHRDCTDRGNACDGRMATST